MAPQTLDDIGACVFDAYGTLFDVHTPASRCRDVLGDKTDSFSDLWRSKQVHYTWLRSLMGTFVDFWHVTGEALDFSLAHHGLGGDAALRARLMELYLNLDCYPEVPAMLATLKKADMKTAILSNGSMTMLESAVTGAGLQNKFDSILSVDRVHIYKPDPKVYQMAVDHLDVAAENICFLSSNGWDAAGAAQFGFQVVWINRFGQTPETLPAKPVAQIEDLSTLPGLLNLI